MYITGIDPTADWTSEPEHALGTLGMNMTDQGTKGYRYVKLRNESASVSAVAGDMAAYLTSPANDEEANTVVTDNTNAATLPVGAGMIQTAVAGVANTAYYGWVQSDGYAVANPTPSGATDGDALFVSGTDKLLANAAASDAPVCAVTIDASAKLIRLKCW